MLFTHRPYVAVLVAALFSTQLVSGQVPYRRRLLGLQQQNALLQQQNAVQTAVQQTTTALQSASLNAQQVAMPNPINLQQQQIALQIAIQETTALLQASFRNNSALGQMALRQLNTLEGTLQQTISLQSSLTSQGGTLTGLQMQQLTQEQTTLMGLLTSQIPPLSGSPSRR